MPSLPVDERTDMAPVCPYCERTLQHIAAVKLSSSIFSKRLLYCCPHCHKVLGVTHRKGLMAQ